MIDVFCMREIDGLGFHNEVVIRRVDYAHIYIRNMHADAFSGSACGATRLFVIDR